MRRFALTLGSLLVGALLLGMVGDAGAGPAPSVIVTRAPAIPAGAKQVGSVAGTQSVSGEIVLRPRDEGALTRFIASVSNAGSADFHHYLAPGQFAGRFGPTQATIAAVRSQLGADGLRVTSVATDGLLVHFTGSASRVESAFQTGLANYKLANGSTAQATTTSVRLPSSIAGAVSSVIGLDRLAPLQPLGLLRGSASAKRAHAVRNAHLAHPAGAPSACAAAQADAQQFGGLTDDQIANAYGAFGLYGSGDTGAGQHIAIFELEPFLPSDIQTFDACYFGAAAAQQMAGRLHIIPVDGGQPTGPGSGEAILDVEDISAMAPGAQIDVYEAPNNVFDNSDFGGLDEYAAIVNSDRDRVVSTSWGLCEQAMQLGTPGVQQAENFLFEQAAAQGQSIFSAAGDTGSDTCNENRATVPPAGQNPLSVDDPSSQPYVVAVGGTTITDATTQPPQEHVWNDGAAEGGGGGGISQSWAMPSWQLNSRVPGIAGVLPGSTDYQQANAVETRFGFPTDFCQTALDGANASTPCRTLPDVSAQADEFTGAVTIFSTEFSGPGSVDGGWITIGGTSSAAPIWAALLADVNASSTCQANSATASGVGFVSPLLYAVASNPAAYKASFNDITQGNNDIYGLDNGLVFPATKGYDMASGLGSPQLTGPGGRAGLAANLCSYASSSTRPSVTNLSPAILPTTGGRVTISGAGFKSDANPVVGIQVGSWEIPASSFTIDSDRSITATFPPAGDTLPPGSPQPQDGSGPANVIVTLRGGESSAPSPASTLQYVDETNSSTVPSVTGLSSTGGSETAPVPVTILGSGFTGATAVTFGGVPATSFTVVSPFEIVATPAPYSSATKCAPSVPGESPTTDICQVQVLVTNAHGTSAAGQILPPLEGALPPLDAMAEFVLPPGCGCEEQPAPTEFDYVPPPSISSVSTTTTDPGSLASENGGTVVTITGKGFNLLTLDWVDFGDPTLASSQDFSEIYVSGTEIQIVAPPQALTTEPTTVPVSVTTLAGQSNQEPVTYAGVPNVTSAINTATGRNGAVDTGGAPLAIHGQGFEQAVGPIEFVDTASPFSLGTQYTYTVKSDSLIRTQTVSQNPALVDVEVCSVTACSLNFPADSFYLYPPGNPVVTSISPTSGPAAGGTAVTINGQNLGCVTSVSFGKVLAEKFSNQQAILDCGSTSVVNATSPPGKVGSKVKVTVTTIESEFTGSPPSRSSASFTYTR